MCRARRSGALKLVDAVGFDSITGKGVRGEVEGRSVLLGNRALLDELKIDPGELAAKAEELRADSQTVMFVAVDGKTAGLLGVADPIKATTPDAIKQLHAEGIRIVMLTGDSRTTAEAVARKLEIDEVVAEVLPDEKVDGGEAISKRGAGGGDGWRRNQRCACVGPGGCRNRDGHRHRRRDDECGRDAR